MKFIGMAHRLLLGFLPSSHGGVGTGFLPVESPKGGCMGLAWGFGGFDCFRGAELEGTTVTVGAGPASAEPAGAVGTGGSGGATGATCAVLPTGTGLSPRCTVGCGSCA